MKKSLKWGKKGIVAVSTLWISIILLILMVALLSSLKAEHGHVLRFNQRTELLYIAEAGLADATMQLSLNNDWLPTDPVEYVFPDGSGKYTITFDQDGLPTADESVNNLSKLSRADGPRGPGTVPPQMADIVVIAEARGRKVRYEALISRGFSTPVTVPLLTTGRIEMEGAVTISGIESIADPKSVEAGVHSNSVRAGKIISWNGLTSGVEAFISGAVTTSSNDSAPFDIKPGFNASDVEGGRPPMAFPIIDVETAVRIQRDLPTLIPQPAGNQTVVSGSDQRFAGGVINGDLVLNGVNLYVNGDLEVNGSISGSGSIYVNGNTSFKGDSELRMSETNSLALFSRGHVTLEGFDGSQFLDSLANDHPVFQEWNEAAKEAHAEIKEIVSDPSNYGKVWGKAGNTTNAVNNARATLGGGPPPPPVPPDPDYVSPVLIEDTLGKMAAYVESNYAEHKSTKFIIDRLEKVRQVYALKPSGVTDMAILNNFRNGKNGYTGLLDVLNRGNYPTQVKLAAEGVGLHNFDKLGTAYFQGVIYTNGGLYAANEVEIVGALLAQKTSDSPLTPLSVSRDGLSSKTLEAGDVALLGGSSIVYNKALLENPFAGSATGPVSVQTWLGDTY